jgi:hypothetical protein
MYPNKDFVVVYIVDVLRESREFLTAVYVAEPGIIRRKAVVG